jgi:hypothetical protein
MAMRQKIQIVSTRLLPIRAILGGFYTTAVVNIISWNIAYSIFPDATFLESCKTYSLSWQPQAYADHLAKYEKRGWPLYEAILNGDLRPPDSIKLRGH